MLGLEEEALAEARREEAHTEGTEGRGSHGGAEDTEGEREKRFTQRRRDAEEEEEGAWALFEGCHHVRSLYGGLDFTPLGTHH